MYLEFWYCTGIYSFNFDNIFASFPICPKYIVHVHKLKKAENPIVSKPIEDCKNLENDGVDEKYKTNEDSSKKIHITKTEVRRKFSQKHTGKIYTIFKSCICTNIIGKQKISY